MRASIIMTTYNQPDWLEKTLWGYAVQTVRDFEVIVADDGSTAETKERIDAVRQATGLVIQHVWHEDRGFRKCTILNKAIVAAQADYLLFTDGDCIPRWDFVEAHLRFARPGCYLSGGAYRLPLDVSTAITPDDIRCQIIFNARWLLRAGMPFSPRIIKFHLTDWMALFCTRLTTTRPTFNGGNASAWREDVIRVNGFDERMQHGGLDRELGQRLENAGIRPLQIRYHAQCLHLDHGREYLIPEALARNRQIRRETRESGSTRTPYGITRE
jgi:glycosyltransferase involved in cell wall biosynthesis